MTKKLSVEATEMQVFVDALREVLGLGPLYGILTEKGLTECEKFYRPVSGVMGPGNYHKRWSHHD